MRVPEEVDHPQFLELRAKLAEGASSPDVPGWGAYPDGLHVWDVSSETHLLAYFFPYLEVHPFGKTGEVVLCFWWREGWGPEQEAIATRLGLAAPKPIMSREIDPKTWDEVTVQRGWSSRLTFGDPSAAARAGLVIVQEVLGYRPDQWLYISDSHDPDHWPLNLSIPDPWPPPA